MGSHGSNAPTPPEILRFDKENAAWHGMVKRSFVFTNLILPNHHTLGSSVDPGAGPPIAKRLLRTSRVVF